MNEHTHGYIDIRESVRHLEHRMDVRFESVDRRFEAVDQRLDSLDQKMSRQFIWLVGMHVTTLIAVVGALVARS